MTTLQFDNWAEAVKYDRKMRKGLTRAKYAELVGVSPGIIQGAELDRKIKPDNQEALLRVMGDLLPESMGGTAHDGADNGGQPAVDVRDPVQGIDSLAEHERVRAWLVHRFDRVKARLGDKPAPPIGTPDSDTGATPQTCAASSFQAWASWLDQVEAHLGPDDLSQEPLGDWLPIDLEDVDEDDVAVVWVPEVRTVSVGPQITGTMSIESGGQTTVVPLGGPASIQGLPPTAEGGAFTDLEMQLRESVERARGVDPASAMAVSSTPDGQREDMEHPVRAERLRTVEAQPDPGTVVQGPWQALDPPQNGRRQPDKLTLDVGLDYFTNSGLQTFQDCKRRWWLEQYMKLAAGPRQVTGAAPLGTRVHQALAVLYVPEGEDPGDPFAELEWSMADDRRYLETINAKAVQIKELEAEHDFAKIIIEGYLEWLEETGADREFQVISTEHGLVVDPGFPGMPNARLLSKEDTRLYRQVDGAVLFIDHKVVQSFEQLATWAHMNRQMLHYGLIEFLLLAEQQFQTTGMNIDEREVKRTDGAILNMLRKVKRTPSSKPPFYHRHQIRYNVETFRSYWRQILGIVHEMVRVTDQLNNGADHHEVCPPRPTQDCSWKCQFFVQCSSFDDGSDVERMVRETFVTIDPLKRYDNEVGRFVE